MTDLKMPLWTIPAGSIIREHGYDEHAMPTLTWEEPDGSLHAGSLVVDPTQPLGLRAKETVITVAADFKVEIDTSST